MEIDFLINGFGLDTPLQLKHPLKRKQFLSYSDTPTVEYTGTADLWIVEKQHDLVYYIRSATDVAGGRRYLGAPNADNSLHLYTTKNRFTTWKLVRIEEELVTFQYTCQKFKTDEVQIIIAAKSDDDLAWTAAYKDIAVIGTGDWKGQTFLNQLIAQYDAIKSRIFFLNGNPLQYNNTVLTAIDNYDLLPPGTIPLGLLTLPALFPSPLTTVTATSFGLQYNSAPITRDGMISVATHMNDKEGRALVADYLKIYPGSIPPLDHLQVRASLPIAGPTYPYTPGGLLTTTLPLQPIAVYEKLLAALTENPDVNDRMLERLWLHLFTPVDLSLNFSAAVRPRYILRK